LKKKQLVVGLVLIAIVAALAIWGRGSEPFDFAAFRSQLAHIDWSKIALATACIYLAYLFRAVRWAWLLRHDRKVPLFSLLGTQVIGFTAVALIGRIADPVRPYLVSKRTGLPVSNQIAVYVVERLFDLGTSALLFSLALMAFSGAAPHVETNKAGALSGHFASLLSHYPFLSTVIERYGMLLLTLFGALFLVLVRFKGASVAAYVESGIGRFSKATGKAVAHKILTFRSGLYTMRSFSDFAVTVGISLAMWALISVAYLETIQAFAACDQLRAMTLHGSVMLMMASGGASIIQLPVIGWFTQIGIVAKIISVSLGVPLDIATASAAMLLVVTFLAVVPIGLIWARFEHVSLRKITEESEHAGEDLPEDAREAAL
jgi:hypothetical protein